MSRGKGKEEELENIDDENLNILELGHPKLLLEDSHKTTIGFKGTHTLHWQGTDRAHWQHDKRAKIHMQLALAHLGNSAESGLVATSKGVETSRRYILFHAELNSHN